VQAACTIDYPLSRFRVLVLDDGNSLEVQQAICGLQKQWSHLRYHTRGKQTSAFGKAGNLNFGLFDIKEDNPAEYFAVLDSDFMVLPSYLRATLPHLLRDPKAAAVTPPAFFYNLPPGDPLSQAIQYQPVINPLLDTLGVCNAGASGSLYRRRVLVDIGGFPTVSMNEDVLLSAILQGKQFRTVTISEPLQFGRVPTSLEGHVTQVSRWTLGCSQLVKALKASALDMLPYEMRKAIAWQGLTVIASLVRLFVSFALVPLILASGEQLVPAVSLSWLKLQTGLATAHLACIWIFEFLQMARTGFQASAFPLLNDVYMATCEYYDNHHIELYSGD
jgi:cellulose synthase/poly-beta-1,6-N-acetylglucosamine synthase-like glycosyltransferase